MPRQTPPRTITQLMATSVSRDAKQEDWIEPQAVRDDDRATSGDEWLWTLISLALLGALLAFVVDDHPLRTLLATH